MVSDGSCVDFRALALDWLRRGRLRRLRRLVFELGRHPLVPFERFCDEAVSGFLRDVGEGWRCGRLRVADEHMAAEAVVEALLRLGASVRNDTRPNPRGGARPLAIVGAMEGDRHHVGALCVRLLLEGAGWRVLYLGADVPLTDYAALQRQRGADLVCISFSPPNGAQDMLRCARALAERYDADRPYWLALGGHLAERPDADEPGLPFRGLGVHESLGSFTAALARGFGRPRLRSKV
jgi:methylmalonyl-CoA mutase cobalamin-binding subunit